MVVYLIMRCNSASIGHNLIGEASEVALIGIMAIIAIGQKTFDPDQFERPGLSRYSYKP